MAFVNVNRENTDQFYRYKMPSLIAKVEGKGNGIKTVVVNMTEIGKALGRPPSYPCKYFGCELGAQTQMDAKNNRYIVNGAHEGSKLQAMLDGFIKKFVLCPECENPETDLDVQSGKGRIVQRCQACGNTGLVDQRHRLTTFILKNPPGSNGDASSKKERKQRGKEKHNKGKGSKDKEPTSPGADEDFDSMPVFSQPNGQPLSANSIDKDDDDDWSMDTSKEAVKARMEKLTDGAAVLTVVDDLEKPTNERMDMFFKLVEQMKKQGGAGTIAANLAKIKSEVARLDLTDLAAGIMAEILYTDRLLDEIKEYRPIMLHFVVDNKKAQRKLLGAFEILVGKEYPQLMSRVPHILKAFYDNDLLEEEVILEWNEKISKKHVSKEKAKEIREKALPFVTWLRTAEEETSDEEEDVEVEYSVGAAQSKLTVVSEPSPSAAAQLGKEEDDEEDDVNIDDI